MELNMMLSLLIFFVIAGGLIYFLTKKGMKATDKLMKKQAEYNADAVKRKK